MYSKELVEKYTKHRLDFIETDEELFEPLALIGIHGKNILDFGCGDGKHALQLFDMGARTVSGIDISPDMIELAQRRTKPGLEFHVADGSSIPFPEKSFDIVFSNFVIHYFKDARVPFAEISRVLRTDGYFVGTFNIAKVQTGHEHLYNTNMPIRLGSREQEIIVQNLIKPKEEIESALSGSHLHILREKVLYHPNAVIDELFVHKEHVTKYAILVIAQKIG